MGRTKRKRTNKHKTPKSDNSDNYHEFIHLQKWLMNNNWKNKTKLRIRSFPETGRGVTATRTMQKNDILITIPYDLMISYTTIQTHLLKNETTLNEKLTIHDFLTLFLVIERNKENSQWKEYINSLPPEPPDLPWLEPSQEINLYPLDLQIASKKSFENFKNSYGRVKKSIEKHSHCVLTESLFKWAYVLVNTRAVYVDPNLVYKMNNSFSNLLLDKPSLALCPFLDMFNHHFNANTEAELLYEDTSLVYKLKTLTKYKKYEQIMISYGPHDNDKLIMQYGFFISRNIFDCVKYYLKDIIEILKFSLDNKQYRFIMDHDFNNDLYIGCSGVSFNLKAVLYISLYKNVRNFSSTIFSDSYHEDFIEKLPEYMKLLLEYKFKIFDADNKHYISDRTKITLMKTYLKYRLEFVKELLNKFCYV